jgi:hypothetical protein
VLGACSVFIACGVLEAADAANDSVHDAGTEGDDATPTDGMSPDGSDGTSPADGDHDTSVPPCGPDFTSFCDTFERAEPVGPGWGYFDGGMRLSIDSTTSTSPTRSLEIDLKLPGGYLGPNGFLYYRSIAADAGTVRVALALKADGAFASSQLVSVRFEGHGQDQYIIFEGDPTHIDLAEQDFNLPGPYFDSTSTDAGVGIASAWARYELAISLDTQTIRLLREGTELVRRTFTRSYISLAEVRVGITYMATGGDAGVVHYDDVGILAK